jgi:hypothetical protein
LAPTTASWPRSIALQERFFSARKANAWSPASILAARPFTPFDVHPDGKRLIVLAKPENEEGKGTVHATFLLNFADELERRLGQAK